MPFGAIGTDVGPRHQREPPGLNPLELLFDLCFVVAVSEAARELNADLSAHHISSGIVGYLMVFFAIWWAWVNFTWFASAYDVDDVPYRIITFVQIVGVLILAAGVPVAFNQGSFATITIGYVVIRVAMVTQWLRAAPAIPPDGRSPCAMPPPFRSSRSAGCSGSSSRTRQPRWRSMSSRQLRWPCRPGQSEAARLAVHPEHIAERYGLFTLIVLGECVRQPPWPSRRPVRRRPVRRIDRGGDWWCPLGVRPVVVVFRTPRRACPAACLGQLASSGATGTTASSPPSPRSALDWAWRPRRPATLVVWARGRPHRRDLGQRLFGHDRAPRGASQLADVVPRRLRRTLCDRADRARGWGRLFGNWGRGHVDGCGGHRPGRARIEASPQRAQSLKDRRIGCGGRGGRGWGLPTPKVALCPQIPPGQIVRQLGAAEVGCRRNKRSIQKRSTPGVTVGFIATIHRRARWLESRPVTGIDLPICAAEAR